MNKEEIAVDAFHEALDGLIVHYATVLGPVEVATIIEEIVEEKLDAYTKEALITNP